MRLLLILLSLTAAPLWAQDRQDQIVSGFEGWMTQHGVTEASIAIVEGDTPVPTFTKGYNRDADAPVTLASLSKALTGACIAVLQQEGVFDLDTPVFALIDAPEDAGNLSDFASQTTGLWPDPTQNQPWHLEADRHPRHHLATQLAFAAERGDRSFRYNNANFAVLGTVIDDNAITDYETDCRGLVLDPLGITTAALDPVWGPLGAWGGWSMSVGDYARFAKEWYATERNIGRDPLAWPRADLGGGASYIMGIFHRTLRDKNLFWHAGLLCWDGAGDGSYFVSYAQDVTVVVSYKGCMDGAGVAALDKALFDAVTR